MDVIDVRVGDKDLVVEHLIEECTLTFTESQKRDILQALEQLRKALDVLECRQITTIGARVQCGGKGKFLKINLSR